MFIAVSLALNSALVQISAPWTPLNKWVPENPTPKGSKGEKVQYTYIPTHSNAEKKPGWASQNILLQIHRAGKKQSLGWDLENLTFHLYPYIPMLICKRKKSEETVPGISKFTTLCRTGKKKGKQRGQQEEGSPGSLPHFHVFISDLSFLEQMTVMDLKIIIWLVLS